MKKGGQRPNRAATMRANILIQIKVLQNRHNLILSTFSVISSPYSFRLVGKITRMTELITSILLALHIIQPLPCEPPEVCTDGLIMQDRIEMLYSEEEIQACAKLIYGEYGSDWVSDTEKAKVVCTVVNRTHTTRWVDYVGSADLMTQLTYPDQFYYYPSFPVSERHYRIAFDVLWRASQIAQGCEGIRWECDTLNYWGDGNANHFY